MAAKKKDQIRVQRNDLERDATDEDLAFIAKVRESNTESEAGE